MRERRAWRRGAQGRLRADVIADVIADVTYRCANLEHAAASTTNLSFSALLIALLSLLLVSTFGPDVTTWGVHPASVVLVVAYVAYRSRSIFHRFNQQDLFVVALTILMTAILLLGLLRREQAGVARIGFESALILVLYVGAVLVML